MVLLKISTFLFVKNLPNDLNVGGVGASDDGKLPLQLPSTRRFFACKPEEVSVLNNLLLKACQTAEPQATGAAAGVATRLKNNQSDD
jgi:hypothetical protein